MKDAIEKIYRGLYDDAQDGPAVKRCWNRLYETVDVSNPLFDAAVQLCRAAETQGFRRGVSLTMRLTAETLNR